jgi:hypothetical protein
MRIFTLLIAVIAVIAVSAVGVNAQNDAHETHAHDFEVAKKRSCGFMDVNDKQAMVEYEKFIKPLIEKYKNSQKSANAKKVVYTIPTVVHVIHNSTEGVGSGRNIPNARIQEQMQILNDDFRRLNADANGTWSQGADCEINFCLVSKYPGGHPQAGQTLPEQGVDRVSTASISGLSNTSSGYSSNTIDNTIKPQTYWNPDQVMNIWVCQLQSGLLGYATFPASSSAARDGTVMGYQYFGNTTAAPFNKGRTTTHEVGHWLGLYHIWGDDFGACSGTDQCADTPNQASETYNCPSGVRTDGCSSSSPGKMYQNFMDYTDDACMNLFTSDQKARMQATMSGTIRRLNLNSYASSLCLGVGIEDMYGDAGVSIYPNPTNAVINIEIDIPETAEINVFSVIGELVYTTKSDEGKVVVDLSNQARGVYFVKVKTGNYVTSKKVMLTK